MTNISQSLDAATLAQQPLRIVVFAPGAIGPTPTVEVQSVQPGFDWDQGKTLILPAQPLTVLTQEDVAAIHKSVRSGSSWHAYQAQQKLRDRITQLEAELAALKS